MVDVDPALGVNIVIIVGIKIILDTHDTMQKMLTCVARTRSRRKRRASTKKAIRGLNLRMMRMSNNVIALSDVFLFRSSGVNLARFPNPKSGRDPVYVNPQIR